MKSSSNVVQWVVAVLIGGTIGFATACGGTKNLCADRNVVCDGALTCDANDGVCKCGGRGGTVCAPNFVCDAITNTCKSTLCVGVDCSSKPGTACDQNDGVCKCGATGGKICSTNEKCDPAAKACVLTRNCNQTACSLNETCDAATGRCKCGTTECAAGQGCSVTGASTKACVNDACTGVACTGANACDPADGYCKCNGLVCQSGEACACPPGSDGGTCSVTDRTCKPGNACVGVTCKGGTTCDPVDGTCRCGGPGGPACDANQICALGPPAQCQGGVQCTLPNGTPKACTGGTSCDPEDGKCKCGGARGQVCDAPTASSPGKVCVSNAIQSSCRRPCDVRSPDCPSGEYCFFDPTADTPVAYCSIPTDTKAEEDGCLVPTACFQSNPGRSLHCNGLALGVSGVCRSYCDVASGQSGCLQVPKPQTCVQIANAPANFGYCQPM